MAQRNLSRCVLLYTFSMGTSHFLHLRAPGIGQRRGREGGGASAAIPKLVSPTSDTEAHGLTGQELTRLTVTRVTSRQYASQTSLHIYQHNPIRTNYCIHHHFVHPPPPHPLTSAPHKNLSYTSTATAAAVAHSPGDGDSRVEVVELGGAERDLLVLLLVGGRQLQLVQLLAGALHRLPLLLRQGALLDAAAALGGTLGRLEGKGRGQVAIRSSADVWLRR